MIEDENSLNSHTYPQQLFREIGAIKELTKSWIDRLEDKSTMRFDGAIARVEERFSSIKIQFLERDVRFDAALQSQKEAASEQAKSFTLATNKSETSMNKQIEGLDSKINDVKERLTKVEGMGLGQQTEHSNRATGNMSNISIISLVVSALIGVGAIIVAEGKNPAITTPTPVPVPVYVSPSSSTPTPSTFPALTAPFAH